MDFFRDRDRRILEILFEYGANPDAQTRTGDTALHMASRFGASQAVSMLLKYGGNRSLKVENKRGETPLVVAKRNSREDIAKQLSQAST